VATVPREEPADDRVDDPRHAAPERARGVVGAVAAMHREGEGQRRHVDIVDRVFGPGSEPRPGAAPEAASRAASREPAEVAARPSARPGYPEIDVEFSLDRVARQRASVLGPASKIAGELVADENVEIHGLVDGGVRARHSRVTVGAEALVQSRVAARSVRVHGTVRGNVTAEDWVEVKPGGVIRGDVRAPRIVLHDGAVVTGRLDMTSAAVRRASSHFDPLVVPPRPRMRKVARAKKSDASPAD
jgi:cytoskeletal protein CcmA (bactofilin family)